MVEKDVIRLYYEISHNPKFEPFCSIYFNGAGGGVSGPEESDEVKRLPLSRLDRILLQRRPLLARLSIGTFKLKSDIVETNITFGGHIIDYERVDEDVKKG